MHILLTNDDGYCAPALKLLISTLKLFASVTTVVPEENCSGISHSISLRKNIGIRELYKDFYVIQGTPVDAVSLAITKILPKRPDLVLSGINEGPNLGNSIFYSGTFAAAREAQFFGIPAIAFSAFDSRACWAQDAVSICCKIIKDIPLPALLKDVILNINIPNMPISEIRGLRSCRLGTKQLSEFSYEGLKDGKSFYRIGPPVIPLDSPYDTDFYAIQKGYISVTPIFPEGYFFHSNQDNHIFEIIEQLSYARESLCCRVQ